MEIVRLRAHEVEKDSASWTISTEERRELYKTVAMALDKIDDSVGAYKIMLLFMNQLEKASDAEISEAAPQARRCIILAIKSKNAINFDELLALKAVKLLESKDAEVFKFLTLFTTTDAQDFKGQVSKFQSIMTKENLSMDDVITKKSYLQICSLSTQTTNYTYSDLSKLLNIAEDDIEEWAIEAIQNKIIDAKIDQLNSEIIIKSHKMREIKKKEWEAIQ